MRVAGLAALGVFLLLSAAFLYLERTGAIKLKPGGITQSLRLLIASRYNPFRMEHIALKRALQDLDQLFASFERVHPDISFYLGAEGYAKLKEDSREELRSAADKSERIALRRFAAVLVRTAAAIGDGHTLIAWKYMPDITDPARELPPFALERRDGRFYITAAPDADMLGKELLSINGVPIGDIARDMLPYISGETDHYRLMGFARNLGGWWILSGRFERTPELELSLKGKDGRTHTKRLAQLKVREYSSMRKLKPAASGKNADLRLFEKEKVAWLDYRGFDASKEALGELDALFERIKASGYKDLVIDIRGNGGGSTDAGEFIFARITDKPYRQISRMDLRISPEAVRDNPGLEKYRNRMGENVRIDFPLEKPQERPGNYFGGRVTVLIGPETFSSAAAFAVTFRDFRMGELIGEETGGIPSCFGEIAYMSLKNSGIEYTISKKRFYGPMNKPDDDKHGVRPDIPLTEARLRPHKGSAQSFVLAHLSRSQKP
ncbi:MAG: peptidase S41 family [Elusimicrobia bacterium]|nr:MAG: peptidase S41 family [Elusimicrobiota bacterium]KAF0158359.1 MAG: peptidase S41 family [Elusimicrobiota bacterium]